MAVRATVPTAGHGQIVHRTEAVEAGVAADLVDGAAQDHLVFTLQGDETKRVILNQRDVRAAWKFSRIGLTMQYLVHMLQSDWGAAG